MATSRNFTAFGRRLKKIADEIEDNTTDIIRGTAIVVDQVVVTTTPIDKGRARSGWNVGIGSEPTFVPPAPPSSPEAGEAGALSQGQSEIGRWRVGSPAIYISNGLPYIRRLNEGYSAQALEGMTDQAIMAGREFAKAQKLLKGI